MSTLTEEISLRDKLHVFEDREEAGRLLVEKLIKYKESGSIVFAIPSGGVPVAYEIAGSLNLPFDLIIVRKIQIPFNTEAGFGAMDPDGNIIFNEGLLNQLKLSENEIRTQVKQTMNVIVKRNHLFREGRPYPSLQNKNIIVVDDGLASGYTMLAAVRFIKRRNPCKIIAAVPTASKRTIEFILSETDELVCLNVRSRFPFAVADAYVKWHDLTDKEVLDIIKRSHKEKKGKVGA